MEKLNLGDGNNVLYSPSLLLLKCSLNLRWMYEIVHGSERNRGGLGLHLFLEQGAY